jgi:hypothetical protein
MCRWLSTEGNHSDAHYVRLLGEGRFAAEMMYLSLFSGLPWMMLILYMLYLRMYTGGTKFGNPDS